jgi:hypothetical protein
MGRILAKVNIRFVKGRDAKTGKRFYIDKSSGKSMKRNSWYRARESYRKELSSANNTLKRNLLRQSIAHRGNYELGSYSRREGTAWQRNLSGFARGVSDKIHKALQIAQREIMEHADTHRRYQNLTGNLITSTMSALYHGRRTPEIMQLPSVEGRGTDRGKLSKTSYKGVYKVKQFGTGNIRLYPSKYLIPTNRRHARAEAKEKLLGYDHGGLGRNSRGDIVSAIILTTGTEYADYLEQQAGLNVLSSTRRAAGRIVRKHLAQLLKSNKQRRR